TSSSLAEFDDHLATLDPTLPFPESVIGQPRGRTSASHGVALPEGWLASRHSRAVPFGAELADSGG
ncbi:MAG: tRNA dihydrouridine synthase DusB, partial [Actinobacteria bacterium]|nr:tRNA dihydrouridine synthase DusB [Actinomycetota bacterium]